MRPIISKILLLFFLLLFQVGFLSLSLFANIPPDWYVLNTGTNHTILISENANPTINEISIDSGDYLGVFFDSLGTLACGGYVMWKNSTTAIAAWGVDNENDGFISGEKFKWKIWDSSIGQEYTAIATYNGEDFPNYDAYNANGMSGVISLNAFPEQVINLHEGWNFYTSYIDPFLAEWNSVFDSIESAIIINQDFDDNISWPIQSKSINGISWAESYKIKVNKNVSFNLWGRQILPEDTTFIIPPKPHHLSYIRTSPASLLSIFEESIDDVRVLKSEDGLMYWPEMNILEIYNLYPGKAYQIISFDTIFLTQHRNDTLLPVELILYPNNKFYEHNLITGNNMSLGILNTAWVEIPNIGDEIGVFSNSGLLVGSGYYTGGNIGITIWGNDETTEDEDGIDINTPFTLKLRNSETGFEDEIIIKSWLEGDSIYQKDKISIIQEIEVKEEPEERTFNLIVQHNPFTNSYQLIITVPEQTDVEVNLFDYSGRFVRNLINENIPIGKYYFDIQLSDLPSSIYFFKMESQKASILKKRAIMKS